MRAISNPQSLLSFFIVTVSAKKLWDTISGILDARPEINLLVFTDLTTYPNGKAKKNTGAGGMAAAAVLRFAVVKMVLALSYRELHDRVEDSIALREFCGIPFGPIPSFTTLQNNIKQLRDTTLQRINEIIVQYAMDQGIEDGRDARLDTSGVESNIHHPTDATLLWDVVRVLVRLLHASEEVAPDAHGCFTDHHRAAHKLLLKIVNDTREKTRKERYRQLIKLARNTVGYAEVVLEKLQAWGTHSVDFLVERIELSATIEGILPLAATVIDQATRRVLNGEQVPVSEKIVSIFEPHTDILVKGKRDVVFGHKILISSGRSNLILDCIIFRGNPADSDNLIAPLERLRAILGHIPKNVATDGGFASKDNAERAQAMGVETVAFSSPKGSKIVEAIRGTRLYKRLCKWRAGIEGIISAVKRAYGLDRCTWRGYESFKAYVQCGVLAFNLHQIACHLLK